MRVPTRKSNHPTRKIRKIVYNAYIIRDIWS